MRQYRQGDILFVEVNEDQVKNLRPRDDRTVAFGEVTGHHHTLTAGTVYGDRGFNQFAVLSEPTDLVHQEHETITIPEGTYRVIRQREWSGGSVRNVAD